MSFFVHFYLFMSEENNFFLNFSSFIALQILEFRATPTLCSTKCTEGNKVYDLSKDVIKFKSKSVPFSINI